MISRSRGALRCSNTEADETHVAQDHDIFPVPELSLSRALFDQIEPFDRDYSAPWLGALRMAMQRIGKEAQRRHGAE